MAEERLIDTDKDKKYRFRINENGEEELIIDDGLTEEEESQGDEIGFEVPEVLEDDEEAAVMTPEQLAEKLRRAEEEKERKAKKIADLLTAAEKDVSEGRFATALEAVSEAEELDPENGRVYALKFSIYTRDFTDYSDVVKAAEDAENVKRFTSPSDRAEMLAAAESGLVSKINEVTAKVKKLSDENEEKKAERAVRFTADRNRALIKFVCGAAPFLAALVLTFCFMPKMFSSEDGVYLILTIVFGALSLAGLIVVAFLARGLNIAARRVRLNKRNTSTKLGRELIAEERQLEALNAVYSALKTE